MTNDRQVHRHGIVPPFVLENIVRNGSSEQRERAQRVLAGDSLLRQQRVERTRAGTRGPREGIEAPAAAKNRQIHDAKEQTDLPGALVRAEGGPATADVAVDEAYDYMGGTWDFYSTVFGRNSWDNAGGPLVGTVHYDRQYDNAFWNGEQMVYGDGDGEFFNRFTIAVDVVGHELTHGVTQVESQLDYQGQAGALNESISDVFGSMVKQFLAGETADQADWLIGEGLFTAAVKGVALRSMSAPGTAYDDPVIGKDPQPGHMDSYVDTSDDNGGVHINSGIPNRAFYLFAVALGGHSWEKAGRVWYATCTDDALKPSANFQEFADITARQAQQLFGDTEHATAVNAWSQVGITIGGPGVGDASDPRLIAVLTNTRELKVQRGALDAEWTTEASDVQAFAVAGERVAVLDTSGQLRVREGDQAWTTVASDVQAFTLDGVTSRTATPPPAVS